jgi:hypothetical protein
MNVIFYNVADFLTIWLHASYMFPKKDMRMLLVLAVFANS